MNLPLRKLFILCCLFFIACTSRKIRHDEKFRDDRSPAAANRERRQAVTMNSVRNAAGIPLYIVPSYNQYAADQYTNYAPQNLFTVQPTPEQIQSCILQTCGPAIDNWGAGDVHKRPGFDIQKPSAVAKDLWEKELGPRFERTLRSKIQDDIMMLDRAHDLFRRGVQVNQEHPMKALLTLIKLSQYFSSYIQAALEKNPTTFFQQVDVSIIQSRFQNLSDVEKETLQILIEKFYLVVIREERQFNPLENRLVQRLRLKYPNTSMTVAQQRDAEYLLAKVDLIAQRLGPALRAFIIDEIALQLLQKAKAGYDLNSFESTDYMKTVSNLESIGRVFDGTEVFQALMRVPYDFESVQRQFMQEKYEHIRNRKVQQLAFLGTFVSAVRGVCEIKISASWELNASDLRLRKIREVIEAVKDSAKTVLATMIEPQYRENVYHHLNQVEFAYPESNAVKEQKLKNVLAAEERNANIQKLAHNQSGSQFQQYFLYGAISKTMKSDEDDLKALTNGPLVEACNQLPIETVSDYALTSSGKISVSWFTANYPELGVSILAHEIGHVVSAMLRRDALMGTQHEKFFQSLQCISDRNPYVTTPIQLQGFLNTTWSEEDWADHFSSLVMNELKRKRSPHYSDRNKACALVQDTGSVYTDTSLDPVAYDTHSSGPLRLLFVGHDRQNLAPVCSQLLGYAQTANRQLNCQ